MQTYNIDITYKRGNLNRVQRIKNKKSRTENPEEIAKAIAKVYNDCGFCIVSVKATRADGRGSFLYTAKQNAGAVTRKRHGFFNL